MDTSFLEKTNLFRGTSAEEIDAMLGCLQAETKRYAKNEVIYHAGNSVNALGVVLSGSVFIENDDLWGNKNVIDLIMPGQVFAEAYASIPGEPLMFNIVAYEPTEVLFLSVQKVLRTCPHSCTHHGKIIENLLSISAQKNLSLSRRSLHTAPKSIRGRLLSYLSFQAIKQGSRDFTIPFNRQQLADYLNVDRSALSNELGKMQKDGLIAVEKNHFRLLADEIEMHA